MKVLFCGLVTSLLTVGQLMLPSSAAPSVASYISKQGSAYYRNVNRLKRIFKILSLTDFQRSYLCNHCRAFRLTLTVLLHITGWAKKVTTLVQCNICTTGITFLAHPVSCET